MEHLLLMILVGVSSSKRIETQCAPGSYLLTPRIVPDICRWYTDGVNFIPRYPEFWHSNRTCFNCTQVRDENLEVLVSPCNKTHDAEILCRDGYYRRRARNVREKDTCVKCSDCENVARPCQGYYDAVCCLPSYEALLNKHGFYECKERPILCEVGEYLSLKTEQCTTCPPGTFMTSDKHNHTNCHLCQTLDDVSLNLEILLPCNQTHPTIFGCKEGYFRFVPQTTEEKVSLCQPCTKCGDDQHEVRKCDRFQDTVCCDSAEMMVEDTDQGPRCRSIQLPIYSSNNKGESTNRAVFPGNVPDVKASSESECGAGEYLERCSTTDQKKCQPCVSRTPGNIALQQQHTLCNTDLTGGPANKGSSMNIALIISLFLLLIAVIITGLVCWRKFFENSKDNRSKTERKSLLFQKNFASVTGTMKLGKSCVFEKILDLLSMPSFLPELLELSRCFYNSPEHSKTFKKLPELSRNSQNSLERSSTFQK